MNPPRKSRLLTGILVVLIGIPVLTPITILLIFVLGKVYGTVVFGAILLLMAWATWFHRKKRRISEAEMVRRIDKAMGNDDPRQMARWIR